MDERHYHHWSQQSCAPYSILRGAGEGDLDLYWSDGERLLLWMQSTRGASLEKSNDDDVGDDYDGTSDDDDGHVCSVLLTFYCVAC